MNRILLFCALGVLWGCRQAAELSGEAITLSCSTSESSKVGALTAGDEVAVFARIEGTETYFLEGEKFITGSDGKTLSRMPAVHYPETKQAVNFYAYFPYHTGNFSVPTDQSTAAALKKADLCWATASSTPVPTPIALEFQHVFARLIVQTNKSTEKIACLVVSSGVLNAATAQFTLNSGKREVSTTGNELILPVQPLTRLVLTVANIEYVFEGSINLQPGQTTTLNLTLHPNTQTATLSGSSTTDWIASSQSGSLEQTASNILTLHWANYVPQGATPDKITLTINNTDYTISSGITYADKTFVVPFASTALRYPYTISKIAFSAIPLACAELLGATIYKSGAQTVGIKDVPNAVLINGLWWATGNLVADGPNGCKIGAPTDCGLFFQFGSLIGWAGGSNGNGIGPNNTSIPCTVIVFPEGSVIPSSFPSQRTNLYYVGGVPITGDLVSGLSGWQSGAFASNGIGDACRYYLGGSWRLPIGSEFNALNVLTKTSQTILGTAGHWFGTSSPNTTNSLFFPASGYRNSGMLALGTGYYWSSTTANGDAIRGQGIATPRWIVNYYVTRSYGFHIRCVVSL